MCFCTEGEGESHGFTKTESPQLLSFWHSNKVQITPRSSFFCRSALQTPRVCKVLQVRKQLAHARPVESHHAMANAHQHPVDLGTLLQCAHPAVVVAKRHALGPTLLALDYTRRQAVGWGTDWVAFLLRCARRRRVNCTKTFRRRDFAEVRKGTQLGLGILGNLLEHPLGRLESDTSSLVLGDFGWTVQFVGADPLRVAKRRTVVSTVAHEVLLLAACQRALLLNPKHKNMTSRFGGGHLSCCWFVASRKERKKEKKNLKGGEGRRISGPGSLLFSPSFLHSATMAANGGGFLAAAAARYVEAHHVPLGPAAEIFSVSSLHQRVFGAAVLDPRAVIDMVEILRRGDDIVHTVLTRNGDIAEYPARVPSDVTVAEIMKLTEIPAGQYNPPIQIVLRIALSHEHAWLKMRCVFAWLWRESCKPAVARAVSWHFSACKSEHYSPLRRISSPTVFGVRHGICVSYRVSSAILSVRAQTTVALYEHGVLANTMPTNVPAAVVVRSLDMGDNVTLIWKPDRSYDNRALSCMVEFVIGTAIPLGGDMHVQRPCELCPVCLGVGVVLQDCALYSGPTRTGWWKTVCVSCAAQDHPMVRAVPRSLLQPGALNDARLVAMYERFLRTNTEDDTLGVFPASWHDARQRYKVKKGPPTEVHHHADECADDAQEPPLKRSRTDEGENKNKNETCPICLADFAEPEYVTTLDCGHIFHLECVDEWITVKKTCPSCRAVVLTTS